MQTRLPTEARQAEIVAAALRWRRTAARRDHHHRPAAAVGMTQGAVFKHFPDQGRDLAGGDGWVREHLLRALQTRPRRRATPLRRLRRVFDAHVDFVVAHPGVPRVIFQELQQPEDTPLKQEVRGLMQGYRELLLGLLERGRAAAASCRPDLDSGRRDPVRRHRAGPGDAVDAERASPPHERTGRPRLRALPARHLRDTMKLQSLSRRARPGPARRCCWSAPWPLSSCAPGRWRRRASRWSQAAEGALDAGAVRHRHGRGAAQLPDRPDRRRPRAARGGRRGRPVKAGQLLAEMDPVDLDERLAALDASLARAQQRHGGRRGADARCRGAPELAAVNARRNEELGAQELHQPGAVEAQAAGAGLGRRRRAAPRRPTWRGAPGPAPPGGRARGAGAAARQPAPAGAGRWRGHRARCRTRHHRGGRPGGAAS